MNIVIGSLKSKVVSDFNKLDAVTVSDKYIESPHYVIRFDENMKMIKKIKEDER